MHSSGTIFVDYASSTIKTHHQALLRASDAMRSKEIHEIWASEHGMSVKSYIGDNGVCKSEFLKDYLKQRHQKMSCSGAGVHR